MNFTQHRAIPRALGALAGIALAAGLVATARPSDEVPSLPASARFTVPLSGELAVDPAFPRPVLEAAGLRPDGPHAAASFDLRNQTGKTLGVAFRAKSGASGLDGLLRVRLRSAGKTIADATLQGLRAGSDVPVELASGAGAEIRVEAWIPVSVDSGYESRSANVSLVPVISEERP
jgi:hypothetical protein